MAKEPGMLCDNCPLLPEGVCARVVSVANVTEAEMRRYRIGVEAPDLLREAGIIGGARLTAVVTSSTNAGIDVGDESVTIARREDRTDEQIMAEVTACEGPTRTRSEKLLRRRGTCGAVRNK